MIYIQVVLVLLFLHTLFYRKSNCLSCGLYGFTGEGSANADKLKILALYNEDRGKDSCGIMVDGEIYKGIGEQAKISEWLARNDIDQKDLDDSKDKTIIGHVRQRSVGLINEKNCHPFDILDKKKNRILVGAMNGTIKYPNDLAKHYQVDITGVDVDSEMLFMIIAKNPKENMKVLKEYKGGCALVMWFPKEKNTLYVFKGASKEFNYSQNISEERPLFYYKVDKGIYYSSVMKALYAIGGVDKTVFTFPNNKLVSVHSGSLTHLSLDLDRTDVDNDGAYYPWEKQPSTIPLGKGRETTPSTGLKKLRTESVLGPAKTNTSLSNETPYFNDALQGSRVYFFKGKYYRTGHIINVQDAATPGPCMALTLDKNGFDNLHEMYDKSSSEQYWFWHGIIIKPEAVDRVNELAAQGKLFDHFYNYGLCLDTAKLSNYIESLALELLLSYGDARLTAKDLFTGTYTPKFGAPRSYKFIAGRFESWSTLFQYDDEFRRMKSKKIATADDESIHEADMQRMITPTEEDSKATTAVIEKGKENLEMCTDVFLNGLEDFYVRILEIQPYVDIGKVKVMFSRAILAYDLLKNLADEITSNDLSTSQANYLTALNIIRHKSKTETIEV